MIITLLFLALTVVYFFVAIEQAKIEAYGGNGWVYAIEIGKAVFGWLIITAVLAWLLLR